MNERGLEDFKFRMVGGERDPDERFRREWTSWGTEMKKFRRRRLYS